MSAPPVRWGILGTARIAAKNWKAIHLSGNSVIRAVASRSLEKSRHFIAEQQMAAPFEREPEALGSYAELLAHPEIEAVYIPLPTGLRKEWVIRAAEAGKHVLSEKPCAVDTRDLEEMLAACRANGVRFMDGVMFMHNPRLEPVRAVLEDPERVGRIRRIHSAFSFLGAGDFLETNIRAQSALEPLGCLGDLGWYCIRFALWVMRGELPERVSGRILAEAASAPGTPGAPLEFSGELLFADGISCGFYCSFLANHQQWVSVSGERGSVRIADFVNTSDEVDTIYEVGNQRVLKAGSGLELGSQTRTGSQETLMIRNFAESVRSGQGDPVWEEMALKTQRVTDACLASARAGGRDVAV